MHSPIPRGIHSTDYTTHNLLIPPHDLHESRLLDVSCSVCSQPITSTSLKCSACCLHIHPDCKPFFVIPCFHENPNSFSTSTPSSRVHLLQPSTTSSDFCHVCDNLIAPTQSAFQCKLCDVFVHKECSSHLNTNCRPFHSHSQNSHHFLKHISLNTPCNICRNAFSTPTPMLRCSQCGMILHQFCVGSCPAFCSFGPLGPIVVQPSSVDDNEQLLPETYLPVLIIANPRSGGHLGSAIIARLTRLLNPLQVFNILEDWDRLFHFVEHVETFILVAAGGDGTLSWVMDECKRRNKNAHIMPFPLGTANDLANVFGWGNSFNGTDAALFDTLLQIPDASVKVLDRWGLRREGDDDFLLVFQNYFSIGLDAEVVNDFHVTREANPESYENPIINKIGYGLSFFSSLFSTPTLPDVVEIFVNGAQIPLKSLITVCFLNIPSYAAGNKIWAQPTDEDVMFGWKRQGCGDGVLEVVGFDDVVMMVRCVMMNGYATRVAQGTEMVLVVKADHLNCQKDGEPVTLARGRYTLALDSRVRMLYKVKE